MLFLGIDGGGTKTEFLLMDQHAKPLARVFTDTIDILQTGDTGYENTLKAGVDTLIKQTGCAASDITYSCIGIPRFGELQAKECVMAGIPNRLFSGKVYCTNDVELGWAGGLGCEAGIAVVAGTGSIGFGVDPKGVSMRCGGWSELFGDEGSAYWLGKKLLELFSKQSDGRLSRGPLYTVVQESMHLKNDLDVLEYIDVTLHNGRKEIAELQRLLHESAIKGDQMALGAYRDAAHELSLIIKAIRRDLSFPPDECTKVSYSGGLFHPEGLLKGYLEQSISDINACLIPPQLTPAAGAALYAMKKYCAQQGLLPAYDMDELKKFCVNR